MWSEVDALGRQWLSKVCGIHIAAYPDVLGWELDTFSPEGSASFAPYSREMARQAYIPNLTDPPQYCP